MNVPGMICFTLVVSLLLAQTEGRAFNNVQAREKRQTNGCDGGIRYDNFGPVSTNIGGQYSNNENCCWEFEPNVQGSTWTITFNFATFDLESSSTCSYDALTFNTEDGPEKECGQKTNFSRTFTVTESQFQMCFTSDGSVTGEGFSGSYSIDTVPENPEEYIPTCDNTFSGTPDGNVTYYGNHGNISINSVSNYDNNQDVCYSLHPSFSGSGIITFVFNVFDIEEATECIFDYIEFDDGNTKLRECGSVDAGTQREFEVHDGRFNVCFHSDGSVTGRGFQTTYAMNPVQEFESVETTPYPVDPIFNSTMSLNFTDVTSLPVFGTTPYPVDVIINSTTSPNVTEATTLPDCNLDIDNLEGTYTLATDSEGQYENNQHCDITIRSPPTPHITTVNFTRFDLEDDTGCDYDSLTITSDEGTEKLCAAKESFIRQYTGQSVDMTFTSDGSVVRSGFSFDYVTEIVYCNATINAQSGTFESLPGGYENNMYCTYTINTPGPGELAFSFPLFDVESSSSCRYDAVEMEGDKLCGTFVEDKMYSTDGHFQFVFTSDGSVTDAGFRINFNFTQTDVTTSPLPTLPVTTIPPTTEPITTSPTEPETCNQVLTSDNGALTSPGNGSYANNEHCVTVITGPNTPYTLVVSFTTFDLESSSNCRYDYLEVDTGLSSSQKGCGSSWSDRTVEYTSDGGNVTLTFSSDSSQTGAGYAATYTIQPRGVPSMNNGECTYINTNISEGVIQSLPGTGSDYQNNMDCSYVFTRNTLFYLNINFTALDTESSSNCRYDYVQVGDDKYCGSDLPNATRVSVQGGSAIIRFRSDSSNTGKGFVALFSIEEHCNFDSDDLEGTYTLATDSEGQYENNQHCDITIRSPPTPHITTVNFTRFDIEDDTGCDYDSLTVSSDDTSEKLCGAKESFIRQCR
ncbi:cubilin-like [Haliotis rubra]|uniref:cubilin-like n=1 Tax=Haliotis rubra TaxID=36100 RepID=UPI001EE53CC5|nr:cubilin-like [Haliotis rubra]